MRQAGFAGPASIYQSMNATLRGGQAETEYESAMRDILVTHPFLHGMPERHLSKLVKNAMLTHFDEGEVIFEEDSPANRFYLIRSGEVSLEAERLDLPSVIVQKIGPGDVLGWSWLFPPFFWQFGARATKPTEAVFLYGTQLRAECEADHDFGFELMKRTARVMVDRLQGARRKIIGLS
jgi:CRP-like cAMP-binding protein